MATDTLAHTAHAHEHGHHDTGPMKVFGFWIYLMSDCIIFATLFATYAVLVNGTAGGPTGKDILNCRSFWLKPHCCCSAPSPTAWRLSPCTKQQKRWFLAGVDWLFGAGFIGMEIYEFHHLIMEGFGRIVVASCPRSSRWSAPTVARDLRSYLDGGADVPGFTSWPDQH